MYVILENKSRNFWGEIKRIRCSGSSCSSCVDGLTCSSDIADLFARQYQELYTSVPYAPADMARIYDETEGSIMSYDHGCFVTVSYTHLTLPTKRIV